MGGVAGCQVGSSEGASLACLEGSTGYPWPDVAAGVEVGAGLVVREDARDMIFSYQGAHHLQEEYVESSPALRRTPP